MVTSRCCPKDGELVPAGNVQASAKVAPAMQHLLGTNQVP
jgi:hypothetical protein